MLEVRRALLKVITDWWDLIKLSNVMKDRVAYLDLLWEDSLLPNAGEICGEKPHGQGWVPLV